MFLSFKIESSLISITGCVHSDGINTVVIESVTELLHIFTLLNTNGALSFIHHQVILSKDWHCKLSNHVSTPSLVLNSSLLLCISLYPVVFACQFNVVVSQLYPSSLPLNFAFNYLSFCLQAKTFFIVGLLFSYCLRAKTWFFL